MAIEVVSGYKPIAWQEKMHSSHWEYAWLLGAKGTTDIDARIYDAELQAYVTVRWLLENRRRPCVLSWTRAGWRKVWASAPYFEGIGPMYRVRLACGREICVSSHHRFLTQRGFVRTHDLTLKDAVFCPQNLPAKLQSDVACALSGSGRALDLTDDYWKGLGQYDGRLLTELEVAQEFFPSSAELLVNACESPSGSGSSHAQTPGSTGLPGILPLDDKIVFFYYASSGAMPRPDRASRVLCEFDEHSSQVWQDVLSGDIGDLEPTLASSDTRHNALWEYRSVSSEREKLLSNNPKLSQQALVSDAPSTGEGSLFCVDEEPLLNVSCDGITSQHSRVESIEYLGHRAYFDLHVPGSHNYVAEGMVHHNSAKTRCGIEELIACAMESPGTRYIIARKTLPSLRDSTWNEFENVLPDGLVRYSNKNERLVELVNGSVFLGRPLDDPKKFESIEISGFLVDEGDEIEEPMYTTLQSRVRQMLTDASGKRYQPRYRGIIASNPPEEDHWLVRKFMDIKPKGHVVFQSATFDNVANLPTGYIDHLKSIYTPDMQQRMIYGQLGKVHKGRPVFPQFSRGNYIVPMQIDPKMPVYRCFDFGFNRPACVWLQIYGGQVRVIGEMLGQRIYLDDFLREKIFPYEADVLGLNSGTVFRGFCDPAGSQESDKGKSSIEILNEHGIFPVYRKTRIEEGIKAVKHFLDSADNGEPNFQVHPRCTKLIEGFRGGYHRLDGEESPNKDGFYDHLFDALRYGAVHIHKRLKWGSMQAVVNEMEDGVSYGKRTGYRRER